MSIYPSLIVGLFAIIIAGITFMVQRYTQIKFNLKEKQKNMKEMQNKISEVYKTENVKDPEVMKKINEMQKEMMTISMDLMKTNFKNMLWIMLLSLLVFVYVAKYVSAPFPVGTFLGISSVFLWYIVVSIFTNIILKVVFVILEKLNYINDDFGYSK